MTICDIVKKLIGKIEPIGETNTDNERFENLEAMTILVKELLTDIDSVAFKRKSSQFSIKRAGEFAGNFLDDIGIEED